MDDAISFLRWWKALRDSNPASSLYPDPKALTKTKHAKAYPALLTALAARWPKAKQGVFKLLAAPKNDLAAQVRIAAKEAGQWWRQSVTPFLVERAVKLARDIRLDPSRMKSVMRNPYERDEGYGSYSNDFLACFAKDGGEQLLNPGTALRSGIDNWLAECLRWYESIAKDPLRLPPIVLKQQPSPPWGETLGIEMPCMAQSPVRKIPVLGDFATPTGRAAHDCREWVEPHFVGSRPIYERVLEYVAHWLLEGRPASLVRAAKVAGVNAWSIANAFDKFMEVTSWQEDGEAHDWFAQVETSFDAWIRTGMGEVLEFKQAPGAPPNTGIYFPAPRASFLWADAVPFGKPERPVEPARATLCGFMVDGILDYWLEQDADKVQASRQRLGARKNNGGKKQVGPRALAAVPQAILINSFHQKGRTRWRVSVNGDTKILSVGPCNALAELGTSGDTTTDERNIKPLWQAFPMLKTYFDPPGPREGRRTIRSFTAIAIKDKVLISESDRTLLDQTFSRAGKGAEHRGKRKTAGGVTSMHKSTKATNSSIAAQSASQAIRKPS